jgi:hypothetical protein
MERNILSILRLHSSDRLQPDLPSCTISMLLPEATFGAFETISTHQHPRRWPAGETCSHCRAKKVRCNGRLPCIRCDEASAVCNIEREPLYEERSSCIHTYLLSSTRS